MDNNKDLMGKMLIDWCQTSLDTDPRYDDGDDEPGLDYNQYNPHYEIEDEDLDLDEDEDLYDDPEVYEAIKEEYVSHYSSEAEALKAFEDWL